MRELKVGPELDDAVASQVMGWSDPIEVSKARSLKSAESWRKAYRKAPGRGVGEYSHHVSRDGTKIYCGKPFGINFPPGYSTGINTAMEVLCKIRTEPGGGLKTFNIWSTVEVYHCMVDGFVGSGDTIAEAICRCALAIAEDGQ